MAEATAQQFIEKAEQARDLRRQMEVSLGKDEEQEFQFYEWSPGRTYVTLWSMQTGEAVTLPRYQAQSAIYLVDETGKDRFTAFPNKAPKQHENTTHCFLHKDSPERELLEEMGIVASGEPGCSANSLANDSAKWAHARSRHKVKLDQYNEEIAKRERDADRKAQAERDAVMMKLVEQRGDSNAKG